MICRFCSQWNADDERRCCFCNNKLADEVDATLDGRPEYSKNVRVTAPVTALPKPGEHGEEDLIGQLKDMGKEQLVGVGLIALGVLGVVIWIFRTC